MQPFSVFSLGRILLVSIEEDIDDRDIRTLEDLISTRVAHGRGRGVIIDVQHLEVMDSYLADHLHGLARRLRLQDSRVVIAGLSVPVVMTLLDFGITLEELEFALDVEQALVRLQTLHRSP